MGATPFIWPQSQHQGELAARLRIEPARYPDQLAAAVAGGWCVFDPATLFPGDTPGAFRFFCDFACDELQVLVGTNQVPPELALVLETGRRVGLDFAGIAQPPNLIHNRVRNQATEVVTFRQVDPGAVDWCAAVGFDPVAVRALRPGEYLARNLHSGGTARGRVFSPADSPPARPVARSD